MGISCDLLGPARLNGVGILVEKEFVDFVVEVRCKSDRVMAIKVVMGSIVLNVISVYAPHVS